jgi:hypothetical protein
MDRSHQERPPPRPGSSRRPPEGGSSSSGSSAGSTGSTAASISRAGTPVSGRHPKPFTVTDARHVRDEGSFFRKQPCSALERWAEASRSPAAGRAGAGTSIARARGAIIGASDWDRERFFPIPISSCYKFAMPTGETMATAGENGHGAQNRHPRPWNASVLTLTLGSRFWRLRG